MATSKKILIFGGTSLYRRDLYRLLSSTMNVKIRACTEYSNLGIKEYDLEQESFVESVCKKRKIIGSLHWYKFFFKKLSNFDIVVIGGSTTLNNWVLFLIKGFLGLKVVSWSHGIYGRESRLRRVIKSLFYSICDLNLVYNLYGLNKMLDNGITKEKVFVVGNCINKATSGSIQISNDQRELFKSTVILFVGRITLEKRIDLLIDAFNQVKSKIQGLKLALVGPFVTSINKDMILSMDSDIHYLGPVYDDNLLRYYYKNSVFCVSPGNVGLTAISSILEGCPVITHDNFSHQGPEFECIVSGENGFFFDYMNADSLALVIEKALKTKFDRERIKIKAKTNWSVESEVVKIEEALGRL